jgi:simple sugar transport system permease protein
LFLLLGKAPWPLFVAMLEGALGSGFALSETLVKAAPIVLCALATALPARLGLVSVGAEGQLVVGAIAGTAFVLGVQDALGPLTLPAMLLCGALGGAALAALAGVLRARFGAHETITTLLLNYAAPYVVAFLVYGPWKDPASLGWPATSAFPEAARLPTYFDTRLHAGLFIGVSLVLLAHVVLARTRFGFGLALLRSSPLLAERAGLSFRGSVVLVMAIAGAAAGLAGIIEASVIEGRLQLGVGTGAGYSGFLVAWLAHGSSARLLGLSLLVAALIAAGDNLQLFADLPSAIVYLLQGLLFAAALIARGAGRTR